MTSPTRLLSQSTEESTKRTQHPILTTTVSTEGHQKQASTTTWQHHVGALCIGYILLSYFVLLNLLIAVFNSTFEKVQKQALNEWLFLRVVTMLEFEAQGTPKVSLEGYYAELSRSSNSRLVEFGLGSEELRSRSRRRMDL